MQILSKCFLRLLVALLTLFSIWCHQACYAGYTFTANFVGLGHALIIDVTPQNMSEDDIVGAINNMVQSINGTKQFFTVCIRGAPDGNLLSALQSAGIHSSSLGVSNLRRLVSDAQNMQGTEVMMGSVPMVVQLTENMAIAEPRRREDIQIVLAIARVLRVTSLNLGRNSLDDTDMEIIVDFLRRELPGLTSLVLSENNISANGIVHLAGIVGDGVIPLQELRLLGNSIGIVGHQYFARALQNNRRLTWLEIGSPTDVIPIADWTTAITQNRVLQVLNIVGNVGEGFDQGLVTAAAHTSNAVRNEDQKLRFLSISNSSIPLNQGTNA